MMHQKHRALCLVHNTHSRAADLYTPLETVIMPCSYTHFEFLKRFQVYYLIHLQKEGKEGGREDVNNYYPTI